MKRSHAFAVAAALLVGGLAGSQLTLGAGESEPSAFISITPCRLLDTRPTSKVGPLTTIGTNAIKTAKVTGTTSGQCAIPNKATAVAMNVTAVDGNAASFLTIWPSDAKKPTTSNLNWVPGAPPTPNKVDVALSADGKISLFNRFGSVNVIADVVGYYEPIVATKGTISAVTVVKQTLAIELNGDGTGANGQAIAKCPNGTVAIAGGIENPLQVAMNVRSSRPNPEGTDNPTGWFGDVRTADETAAGKTATVYAVCITLNL